MNEKKTIQHIWKETVGSAAEKYRRGTEIWEFPPPDIQTFIDSPEFLNMSSIIFPGVREDLCNIFRTDENGELKINYVVLIQAPGSGKSELASVATAYIVVRLLCMRSPQKVLDLSPTANIQIINSSASGDQAKRVVFEYIKNKLKYMPFLKKLDWSPDESVESELRFPKGIRVTPASSTGKTVLGSNLFAVIMDELNEYVRTKNRDLAEMMFNKFYSRMLSRFGKVGKYFVMLISQAGYADSFIEKKFEEWKNNPRAYVCRRAHWQARPHDYKLGYFTVEYFDEMDSEKKNMQVPIELKEEYQRDPILFLRNWASIPSRTIQPFFYSQDVLKKIFSNDLDPLPECKALDGSLLPFFPENAMQQLPKSYVGKPGTEYYCFTDLAKGEKCKVGFCLVHSEGKKEIQWYDRNTGRTISEFRDIIVVDLVLRFSAPIDGEVPIYSVRDFIIWLKKERSYNITTVGTDSWQSLDFRQVMASMGFQVELVGIERDKSVYQTLKDVINEGRLKIPYHRASLLQELSKLEEKEGKVFSQYYKDQADALCGAVYLVSKKKVNYFESSSPPKVIQPVLTPSLLSGGGGALEIVKKIKW